MHIQHMKIKCNFAKENLQHMEQKGKILIIDDNEDVLFALNLLLEPYVEKIKVTTQPSRIEHFMTTFHPDVVLLDMNFRRDAISGQEGFDCLEQIQHLDPQVVVIFMTAYSDTDKAVRAIKAGATDFISKPWEKEKLLATLSSAVQLSLSRKEVGRLQEQVSALKGDETIPELIGNSPVMSKVKETIYKLSDTDANILILGENGTGKDLVARLLKHFSPRSGDAFITIDLGSIPEQLFESELFGYEKGAFTDARKAKPGRMEVASGGTLFLDEIGNLPLAMQAKLLTAIEKRCITRLGAGSPIDINVRLICATNANLRELVEEGKFRQDLLYRINTIHIEIPPLRERKEDIIPLAERFIDRFCKQYDKGNILLSTGAQEKLRTYPWYGNIRELEHAVEKAVIINEDGILSEEHFHFPRKIAAPATETSVSTLEEMELQMIQKAIEKCNGNLSAVAAQLGITRQTLYNKMKKFGL